jgi:hypothetical protein
VADYYERRLGVLSYSIAKQFDVSPWNYLRWLEAPKRETDALRFGKAVDVAFLTPDEWESSVAVAPDVSKQTKEGKATHAAFAEASTGKIIISASENQTIMDMSASLADPVHSQVVDVMSVGERQREVHWVESGVQCQARLDILIPQWGIIADLKTTACVPSAYEWRYQVRKYGYDAQAAWYFAAADSQGIPCDLFAWVIAEKSPPHHWVVHSVRRSSLGAAIEQRARLLERFAGCMETNHFPGIIGEEINL